MQTFCSNYVKAEEKDNVKAHNVKTVDNSILYKYVTSPLCNFLVKFVPRYVA